MDLCRGMPPFVSGNLTSRHLYGTPSRSVPECECLPLLSKKSGEGSHLCIKTDHLSPSNHFLYM